MGIEEKLPSGVLLTTVEGVAGYMRKASFWPATFGLACCAIEMMTTGGPKYDLARFGMEVFRASPRQADLMIVAGRVSQKMAPVLRQIYDQMPDPKWVLAMGVCASSGGMFNNYAIVQGVDHIVPVDMYLPGCPPRPEMLMDAILKLHDKIMDEPLGANAKRRERLREFDLTDAEEPRGSAPAELFTVNGGPATSVSFSFPTGYPALFAAAAAVALPAMAQKTVTFAYQDMMNPWRWVQQSQEIEKATGFKINWRQFGGGGDVIRAMASGDVQLGEQASVWCNAVLRGGFGLFYERTPSTAALAASAPTRVVRDCAPGNEPRACTAVLRTPASSLSAREASATIDTAMPASLIACFNECPPFFNPSPASASPWCAPASESTHSDPSPPASSVLTARHCPPSSAPPVARPASARPHWRRRSATAKQHPARVDLAGGTLDLWPLHVLHPGTVTVNVAVGLYASCRARPAVKTSGSASSDCCARSTPRSMRNEYSGRARC